MLHVPLSSHAEATMLISELKAEGSYTLCCDFCATTARLNQAENESLFSVPLVKKKTKQSKPKLFFKMSATAFSLSLT